MVVGARDKALLIVHFMPL